ncbi:TPA: hypothetical protein ACH3X1_001509 [Trebouxia sp. C0004]
MESNVRPCIGHCTASESCGSLSFSGVVSSLVPHAISSYVVYSVTSRSQVALRCFQLYIYAASLYLAELDQFQGIYKADLAQLCQEVSQTQSSFRLPHTLSSHHVRQGSQKCTETRSLTQLIYSYGYQRDASASMTMALCNCCKHTIRISKGSGSGAVTSQCICSSTLQYSNDRDENQQNEQVQQQLLSKRHFLTH